MKPIQWNEDERRVTSTAIQFVIWVAREWDLTDQELSKILGVQFEQLIEWRSLRQSGKQLEVALDEATLNRVGCLIGIYRCLRTLFPDRAQANGWVRRPNSAEGFDGQTALSRMTTGEMHDLMYVFMYLQSNAN